MIAVPFVLFFILTLLLYRKFHFFNTPCIISLFFTITSFFSILVDVLGLRGNVTFSYVFSYAAPFFFCFYIFLCLVPLIIFAEQPQKKIYAVNSPFILKVIAVICFCYFILNLVLSFDDIVNVLTGDIRALRAAIYRGEYESGWIGKVPGIFRFPFVFLNMVMSVSWIYIFFAFYCLCVQKMPIKYFVFFIVSSLMEPVVGIVGVDRSKMTYWLISFYVVFVFFKPYLSSKQNKLINIISLFLALWIVVYLSTMTDARFSEQYYGGGVSGSLGSAVSYLGQSYINFCYFFDNVELSEISTAIFLPFTNTTILRNPIVGGTIVQTYFSNMTGYELGVFYTYLGQILVTAGHYILFIFVCAFFWISMILLKRKKMEYFSLLEAYIYLSCASVLFLGIFVHYYSNPGKTFALVFFAGVSFCLTKNVKLR